MEHWGRLADRYRNREQPRRMLALDGGGIRGVLTLQVLSRLEAQLAEHYGERDFRLCQFFDYIGGTSTGAILAAGLARGHSCGFLQNFYRQFGQGVFAHRDLWRRWQSLYDDGKLRVQLRDVFGDADLGPEHLETLLLVVTHNVTTDSAWPVSSNPDAKYNDANHPECNLRIPLWRLVRASTAAPIFFPPEVLPLGDREFVFADGGTTAYRNPAFLMTRMATDPAYRLGWQRGEDKLLVVSVGAGSAPVLGTAPEDPERNLATTGLRTLGVLMSQAAFDQDVNCRTVGLCIHGERLDAEVGDLIPRAASGRLQTGLGRAFVYARYEAPLTDAGIGGLGVEGVDPARLRRLDAVDHIPALERIGAALAEQVDVRLFGGFLDRPPWPRLNHDCR